MYKKIAQYISVVFHPILIPLYSFYFLLNNDLLLSLLHIKGKIFLFLIIAVGMVLLPASLIPFFRYFKLIRSYQMEEREERYIPLAVSFVLYIMTYLTLRRFPVPAIVPSYVLGGALLVLVNLLVMLRWKMSLHSMSLGGLTGIVTLLYYANPSVSAFWVIASLLLSGLVATARLFLNAHTPAQVYTGFVSGFVIMLSFLWIFGF
jgi:hypothetical protein